MVNQKAKRNINNKHLLFKIVGPVVAILAIHIITQTADCILIAQKPYVLPLGSAHYDNSLEDINLPYLLSINEGDSIDVAINSEASLVINLNRPVPQDVSVFVSVFSGPNLITFERGNATASNYTITYDTNTFGDRNIKFKTNAGAGHAEIVCKIVKQPANITIDDSSAYISVNISKDWKLNIVINIVGWIYFFAWSASFYFQVILNYQRKSVIGLNFDFLALNFVGFTCYSIYNFTFLFSDSVRREYYKKYTFSRIPVEYNDLFFALHALLLTSITVIQCFIYERGQQMISVPAGVFIGLSSLLGLGICFANLFHAVTVLDVVLYLSYVKLVITIIKYAPQAFMNYQRKATTGWSIHNILLDFTGGVFSIAQMLFLAYNYDDWVSIFGNFTKFGLGVISMTFDIIFVVQHYILYAQPEQLEDSIESVPSPVISHSVSHATQPIVPSSVPENSNEGNITERED